MSMRGIRIVATLALAATFMMAAAQAAADALIGSSHGYRYKSSQVPAQSFDSRWSDQAGCGSTRVATSGGALVTGLPGPSFLGASFPAGAEQRRWEAGGYVTANATATTYALCERESETAAFFRSKRVALSPAPAVEALKIGCGAGNETIGGGQTLPADSELRVRLNDAYPATDGWHVTALNQGGVRAAIRIWAVCVPDSAEFKLREFAESPLPAGAQYGISGPCFFPFEEFPVSGGIRLTGPPAEAHIAGAGPEDEPGKPDPDVIPDDRWRVDVANDSGDAKTYVFTVVCRQL